MKTKLYIDGTFCTPVNGQSFPAINPATQYGFGEVAAASGMDADIAVHAARRAFDEGTWPNLPAVVRANMLRRIAEGIRNRLDQLALLETRDNGKPLPEAQWDIEDAAFCFEYYADMAENDATVGVQTIEVGDGRFDTRVLREPIGVVVAITPWNFPILMAAWKLAPALAAGCTVVLKPSELCTITCFELAKIIHEARLPAGVFNLLTGFGSEVGEPLVNHPLVDKIAFTGSVATGRKVMQAAARGIRVTSLELGGKSPLIIFDDCDLDRAVEWTMFGIFWNKGEVCSATSRVLVQRGLYETFLQRLKEEAEAIPIGNGEEEGVKLGPIVSKEQYEKVLGFLTRAKDSSARLVCGGGRPNGFDLGYYIEPTVYADVPLDAEIWCEEIFGPVVCVNPFDSEEEAIMLANDSPFGLAGAVMSDNLERCDQVAGRLRAGVVWINCSQPTFVQAPWGGYKSSGIGRELGREGYDACFETKQVTRFNHEENWGWYLDNGRLP